MNFAFSVANNELGPKGAKILADMLHVNTSMTSMDLSCNQLCGLYMKYGRIEGIFHDTGIKAIAEALSVSSSMTSLK